MVISTSFDTATIISNSSSKVVWKSGRGTMDSTRLDRNSHPIHLILPLNDPSRCDQHLPSAGIYPPKPSPTKKTFITSRYLFEKYDQPAFPTTLNKQTGRIFQDDDIFIPCQGKDPSFGVNGIPTILPLTPSNSPYHPRLAQPLRVSDNP